MYYNYVKWTTIKMKTFPRLGTDSENKIMTDDANIANEFNTFLL